MLPPQQHYAADPSPMAPPLDPIAPLRAALRGHYDIEREIGQGAFATVYLARDLKHERKVAIKVLHADPTSETGELRFIREIRLLARLQHPNILSLHDSGHVEALLYYVMPYVSGETLRDRINRERQLVPGVACNIARDIADALAYAHGQGIIHRDIKPENILLSAGHPVLADFGIARAIDLAGVRQLTRTGMGSPGTPAYMSPEQLLGDKELDGRSDTYSLACVLYEMLVGKPPFAGKEGFVRRFTEAPPNASLFRHDLPEWIDRAIARALNRDRDERFPTAGEFASALRGPNALAEVVGASEVHDHSVGGDSVLNGRRETAPPHEMLTAQAGTSSTARNSAPTNSASQALLETVRSRPRTLAILAAILVLVGTAGTIGRARIQRSFGGGAALDTTKFVVLPFAGPSAEVLGSRVEEALYDALSGWSGLPLVPDTRVSQVIAQRHADPMTEAEALSTARFLGAGRLIWGQVSGSAGDARIRVHLYDVASNESRDEFLFRDSTADGRMYPPAVQRLLRVPNRPVAADGGDGLTQSFPAWSSYGKGHVALADWDLAGAEREFESAATVDAGFAPAQLWLGQVRALRNYDAVDAWREPVDKALEHSAALKFRELGLARALSAFARADFSSACHAFRELLLRDSADFVAWYGLGYCGARDNAVLPDPKHPGKWEFRSSYRNAASAFSRATEIEPRLFSVLAFDTLLRVAPIQASQLRQGATLGKPRLRFAAYPSLVDDTLGYTPFPLSEVLSGQLVTAPQSINEALRRNRDFLLKLVLRWTGQFPDSARAFQSLAILQESRGELGVDREGVPSALTAVQMAERLSRDSSQRVLLSVGEIRLRLKQYQFERARALSDSLVNNVSPVGSVSGRLAGIAALTGKISLTEKLLNPRSFLPGDRDPSEPLPSQVLLAAATALYVNAALGVCSDEFDKLAGQIDVLLQSYATAPEQQKVRNDLTTRAWTLAFPCRPAYSLRVNSPSDRLLHMQQSLAGNDIRAVRAQFDSTTKLRASSRPGDVSMDYLFQEAWLLAAIGDTAAAIKRLDLSLAALPTLGNSILEEVPQAAALVRAMMLRADLASAAKDSATARKWAGAAAILWAHADPPLQPALQHLRLLSQNPVR